MEGGFKKVGKQTRETRDGHEVMSQELSKGPVSAMYLGFFNRGYYVSILLFGPHNPDEHRAAIVKSLIILPDVAK
jgi:hypothetical protein